jgi:hypothetical protein
MTDKKCPKCGLWNTEIAEVCDCGYNFINNQIQSSISKKHEYNRLFERNKLSGDAIRKINKNIQLRILLSLILLFIVNIPTAITFYGCFSFIFVLAIIIFVNVYSRNEYESYVLRKIWKFPIIGIVIGYILDYILMIIIILNTGTNTEGYFTGNRLPVWFYIISVILMFVLGIIGFYIGRKKVIIEIENYIS